MQASQGKGRQTPVCQQSDCLIAYLQFTQTSQEVADPVCHHLSAKQLSACLPAVYAGLTRGSRPQCVTICSQSNCLTVCSPHKRQQTPVCHYLQAKRLSACLPAVYAGLTRGGRPQCVTICCQSNCLIVCRLLSRWQTPVCHHLPAK